MKMNEMIHRLVSVEEPEGTIATLTLDVSGSGILPEETRIFLKEKVWKHLHNLDREAKNSSAFGRVADRIRDFVDNRLKPGTDGAYLVAGREIWETLELDVPFRNFFHVGRAPYLAPLVEIRARWPKVYVVRCDERRAELLVGDLGVLNSLQRFEAEQPVQDVERVTIGRFAGGPGAHRASGRRDRFERTREEGIASMIRAAARKITSMNSGPPPQAVFLQGDREYLELFRERLPAALRENTSYLGPVVKRRDNTAELLLETIRRAYDKTVERHTLEFSEKRAQGAEVALGPREVLEALPSGRVVRVYLNPDEPLTGLKCMDCGTRYPGLKERCDFCPGPLSPVSITQEVIAHGVKHPPLGVAFIPSRAGWLRDLGGMSALLARKGLRMAT
ncbi:MAG: hypothetical protein HY716_04110 [Planctomycetes bacterium]|nr:hypothetical protein [Planctomycetota bacterium]